MLKPRSCDVAVIGTGSAGLAAYRASIAMGARTLLIEAGKGGTTCVRFGCMPSKLLLAAGRAARDARNASEFGVTANDVKVDGRAVMRRVHRLRDAFLADVMKTVAAIPETDRVQGRARFAGPEELTIDDHTRVTARAIVIATGARPTVPDDLKSACGDRLLTHETLFDLDDLPSSIAVIGAGPLGLELALACARLGVRTALFDEGADIGGVRDPVVAEAVRAAVEDELALHQQVQVSATRSGDGDVTLKWTDGSGTSRRGRFEYVLAAAGRAPAVDNLDLNLAGVDRDKNGVPIFNPETLQCGRSSLFIAGDANEDRPVLHEASLQGRLAGANAARFHELENRTPMPEMALVYSDPDIARVGPGFSEDDCHGWVIGCSDSVGRATVDDRNPGVSRVYAEASTGVLLGGELFGPDIEHLAHLLAWAVQLKLTAKAVLELAFYHPTVEEGLRTALGDIARQLD